MNTSSIWFKNIRLAVKDSIGIVQEEAQEHHRFTSRNGALERSVDTRLLDGSLTGEVFLNTNIAPYGPWVHQGTKAHVIRPKRRMALRWVSQDSVFLFAKRVKHPGTKKDPFLYDALRNKTNDVHQSFERYTGRALREVANEYNKLRFTI